MAIKLIFNSGSTVIVDPDKKMKDSIPRGKGFMSVADDGLVILHDGKGSEFARGYYSDFVDSEGNPYANLDALQTALHEGFFAEAPVTQGQMEAYVDGRIQNISQEDYDALTTEQKNNGTLYLIPAE